MMELKKLKRLLLCSVLLVPLPMVVYVLLPKSVLTLQICTIASVILVVAYAIAVQVLYRCPYCGKYLGGPGWNIRCCPQCGKELFGE